MAKRIHSLLLGAVLSACGGQAVDVAERGGGGASGSDGGRPPECAAAKDCAADERCVVAASGRMCMKREESACRLNSDCQPPLVCATDGQCRNECVADRDCMMDQVCARGRCVQGSTLITTDAGCPVLRNGPFYQCAPVPSSEDTCVPRDPADAGAVGYPVGCNYVIPSAPLECMLQICMCVRVRSGRAPEWICPK